MTIKATIWDFSGVILHPLVPDPHASIAKELGVPSDSIKKYFDGVANAHLDLGDESEKKFYQRIIHDLGLNIDIMHIFKKYFFDLFQIDEELMEYIRKSRVWLKTALCSNFSKLLRSLIRNKWGIEDAFDVIVISSEVKLLKPEPAIYQLTLEKLGIKAEEAIFIDDQEKNIEGAQVVGMHGVVFKNLQQTIVDIEKFKKLLDGNS